MQSLSIVKNGTAKIMMECCSCGKLTKQVYRTMSGNPPSLKPLDHEPKNPSACLRLKLNIKIGLHTHHHHHPPPPMTTHQELQFMKWPLGNSGATVSLQCTHSRPPRQPPRKPYRLYGTGTVSAAPETAPRYLRRPSRSLSTLVLVGIDMYNLWQVPSCILYGKYDLVYSMVSTILYTLW